MATILDVELPNHFLVLCAGLVQRRLALASVAVLAYLSTPVRAREIDPPNRVLPEVTAPLARAHAHNDYEHRRPLFDALARGFASVEADVWLSGGQLLVAHHYFQTSTNRTLASLYLEPLRKRVAARGGSVYRGSQRSFQLLIDVKWDGENTYRAIHAELARYPELFTRYEGNAVYKGPVTAIISGKCPHELLRKQRVRYAGCDGSLDDLRRPADPALTPLISERWGALFDWEGQGAMPSAERAKLRALAMQTRGRRQQLRFWGTPDQPAVWNELLSAGVDYIGSDALDRLRRFLSVNDRL
ncbi:MAG TPA: phosphatidylinositol-specific phospholipase C/glycerophosphodiester phosphodiesterase family protein [Polyangiales bacterium]|nr:phosphatidylinositol-specific phospholipase C/glycerophosphodiester phosphodiesterase family protein [Polyangiales bacterium]